MKCLMPSMSSWNLNKSSSVKGLRRSMTSLRIFLLSIQILKICFPGKSGVFTVLTTEKCYIKASYLEPLPPNLTRFLNSATSGSQSMKCIITFFMNTAGSYYKTVSIDHFSSLRIDLGVSMGVPPIWLTWIYFASFKFLNWRVWIFSMSFSEMRLGFLLSMERWSSRFLWSLRIICSTCSILISLIFFTGCWLVR